MANPESHPYLQAFRRTTTGPGDARARNLAAIRTRLARGEHVDDESDEVNADEPRFRRAASVLLMAKPVALSVTIAAASVGTIKVGAMTYAAATASDVETTATSDPPVHADPPPPQPRSRSVAASATPEADQVPTAEDPASPPAVRPSSSAPPSPHSSRGPQGPRSPHSPHSPASAARPRSVAPVATPPNDELRREIALMERAQTQLQGERYEALLVTLAEHAQAFDKGAMVLERHGWAAIAHCRLGHRDAPADAETFLRRHGGTALAQKVRRACDGSASNKSSDGAISSDG